MGDEGALLKSTPGVVLFCLLLALIFFALGLFSDSWRETTNRRHGLWSDCINFGSTGDICISLISPEQPGWLFSTQALITLAASTSMLSVIASLVFIFIPAIERRFSALTLIATCSVATFLALFGVTVFVTNADNTELNSSSPSPWSYGWSMALTVTGAALSFIAVIMVAYGRAIFRLT